MYKALIADDEYYIRHGLVETVEWEEYGIEVIGTCADGKKALEMALREEPHIVITDVDMPEMNGLQLLREIRDHLSSVMVIVISGYNEFDYVKEALRYGVENYILKPLNRDELSETLQNTVDKLDKITAEAGNTPESTSFIEENILCRLVMNMIAPEEAKQRFDFLNMNLHSDGYSVVVVKNTRDKAILNQTTLRWVRQATPDVPRNYIFEDLKGNIVILFCLDDDNPAAESIASDLLSNAPKDLKNQLFISVGGQADRFTDIHRSYEEALELQQYRFIYPTPAQINFTDKKAPREQHDLHDSMNSGELTQAILHGNKEAAEDFFKRLGEEIKSSDLYTPRQIRSYFVELAVLIYGVQRNNSQHRPAELYNLLFNQNNPGGAIVWLCESSLDVIDKVVQSRAKPKSLVDTILEYIDLNFDHGISLKTIAAEFQVNPSYLGQMFKRETNMLFTNYLNELRINKAEKMLLETSMKANIIARKVGYADANYFYKIFKKITGVYPSHYKRR